MLGRLDRYFDVAPRSAARVEDVGAFRLFVADTTQWSYYARPRPGVRRIPVEDVRAVRARLRALRLPEAFEWVHERAPTLAATARRDGLRVRRLPLMVLDRRRFRPVETDLPVRFVRPRDRSLRRISALITLGFGTPGTDVGPAGVPELTAAAAHIRSWELAPLRRALETGDIVLAVAEVDGVPVATGSHQPVPPITEVVGVATLPAFRRRGLGAAVTSVLVSDALDRGLTTVCLSAGSRAVSRIYERLGFHRVGTVCLAEPAAAEPGTVWQAGQT